VLPRDVSGQFLVPEGMYGREVEIHDCIAAFDRVVTEGRPELMLVSGPAGAGKSSLVNELQNFRKP
jgi:predicted ATPase